MRVAPFLAPALLLLAAGVARADLLVPRSGKPVRGVLVKETEEEVVFNPYWSRHPEMTYEVIRLPRRRVKRVEIAPHPEVEVFRRLAAREARDTAALLSIGRYAKEHKLKAHARMCWALALAEDPESQEALKGIGGRAKWEKARKGNPHLDAELLDALRAYAAEGDVDARRTQARALADLGFAAKPPDLERYRRSALQPTGLHEDRPLSWLSDEFPGAVYTLYVPPRYDPALPWPLVVGLHGGGPDGKAGDEVVGSGRMAMNFYRDLAARDGYLVACPDALQAPWPTPTNEKLVRAMIEELKRLYNVDVDRIYLTGHSMGGFGTWGLGPKMAADLAAISPMAGGGGGGGIGELVKTRTPIFIYHSEDDYVRVDSDRQAAKRLQETDLDFVYTELNGKGHSLPASIREELFAFFGPRRRHDPKHKEAWPRSSLHGKVTTEEERYLGDPLEAWDGETPTLGDLVDRLELGGGRAAAAAAHLGETKPEGAAAAVAKVLRNARLSLDARAWAARALGLLGDGAGAKTLRKAVAEDATRDGARLAAEAARALARLGDGEAGRALARAVAAWVAYYDAKVANDTVAFSDWERSVPTLAVLVTSWTALGDAGDAGDPEALAETVVRAVLAPNHEIQTSERVPQNPSAARVALAKAVAEAYAAWGAETGLWDALLEAVRPDERAHAAVEAARR